MDALAKQDATGSPVWLVGHKQRTEDKTQSRPKHGLRVQVEARPIGDSI
jgi:hypothetical protein